MEIIKTEIINENGVDFKIDTVKTENQTATIKIRMPTEEEIKQREYNYEQNKTIEDVKLLQDKMIIGEATQTDIDNRLSEWNQWKIDNGWT